MPPPPPDAWGNRPGQPRQPDSKPALRGGIRGYTPSGPSAAGSNVLTDFYGERLAPNGVLLFSAIIDGILVWWIPTYIGYQQWQAESWGSGMPKPNWELLEVPNWYLVAFIAFVNFTVLVMVTGGSVGMWLCALKACTVWSVPGPPEAKGGHYFVGPMFGQAFSFTIWHSLVDLLFFGLGHVTTNHNQLAQTYGAKRAGLVIVERAWLLRLYKASALGPKAVQVAPDPPIPVRKH
jgi:hypothetical protein